MATSIAASGLANSAIANGRASLGAMLRAQVKIAAVVYPTLMTLAFAGAVTAAHLNPDVLKPFSAEEAESTLPPLPTLPALPTTAPTVSPVGETAPLVSQIYRTPPNDPNLAAAGSGVPSSSATVNIIDSRELSASISPNNGDQISTTSVKQQLSIIDAFGEPRRVRTGSVKPDTLVQQPMAQQDGTAQALVSTIPTMTMPDTPATSTALPPSRTLPSNLTTAPAATLVTEAPLKPSATPAAHSKAPQRVASVSPDTTSSTTEPAPASASPTDPVSGYSVQLGVRGSESEARTALREMQGKYSQLVGKPELIRQVEVNGKPLFRVRVGPMAKSEAASLCSVLHSAGDQCFVAKN